MNSWFPNWFNNCNRSVPKALRYLAENARPSGGQDDFNSEHLYQLAGEIEKVYNDGKICPYGSLMDSLSLSANSLKDHVRIKYQHKEGTTILSKKVEEINNLLLEISKIRNQLYPSDVAF